MNKVTCPASGQIFVLTGDFDSLVDMYDYIKNQN